MKRQRNLELEKAIYRPDKLEKYAQEHSLSDEQLLEELVSNRIFSRRDAQSAIDQLKVRRLCKPSPENDRRKAELEEAYKLVSGAFENAVAELVSKGWERQYAANSLIDRLRFADKPFKGLAQLLKEAYKKHE